MTAKAKTSNLKDLSPDRLRKLFGGYFENPPTLLNELYSRSH